MECIPLSECKHRFLYRIFSRNLAFGVFDENNSGFVGIREKFGRFYLFTEHHRDTGAPYGTVSPLEELEPLPENIRIEESLGVIDVHTRRPVEFDKPVAKGGKGWFFADTGESSRKIAPLSVSNADLFNWLREKEEQHCR